MSKLKFAVFVMLLFSSIKGSSQICFDLFDKNKNYVLEVTPTNLATPPQYSDREKVSVCTFNNTLKLVKKNGGLMPLIKWKSGGTKTSNPVIATTSASDFVSGLNKIVIEIEGEKDLDVFMRIIDNEEVDEKRSLEAATYSLDMNTNPSYSGFSRTIPIKFLEKGLLDQMVLKSDPNQNASNHIEIVSDKLGLSIDPLSITKGSRNTIEHEIESSGLSSNNVFEISTCSNRLYEIETYASKTLNIHLYTLRESDDDEANFCTNKNGTGPHYESGDVDGTLKKDCTTPITSPNFVCINPGADGTLDLYNYEKSWLKGNDKMVDYGLPSAKVIAGPAIGSGKITCETIPVRIDPNDPSTHAPSLGPAPNSVNVPKLIADINEIYNKVGIQVNVIDHGIIAKNFDLHRDDNILTVIEEQQKLHLEETGSPTTPSMDTKIWIVNDIYEKVKNGSLFNHARGAASHIGLNTVSLNNNSNPQFKMTDRTFAHEVGHAKFSFYHTDSSSSINDGVMPPTGVDKTNFMNSGSNPGNVIDPSKLKVRQYQWELIHSRF